MHPAVFLDRDGVIIENRPAYVRSWVDVCFLPGALTALAQLTNSPYKVVIVTNQSGIGRGLIPQGAAEEINRRLVAEIERGGGRIDGVYMCPHKPQDQCPCRKPQPGMILKAAAELSLDLSRSLLIGDALSDLQAAEAAGIRHAVLVRTGRGADQEKLLPDNLRPYDRQPFLVYDDLAGALKDLIGTGERGSPLKLRGGGGSPGR